MSVVLYSLGYQTLKKVEQLVALARQYEATIADIRYAPWSQNSQWRADEIQKAFLQAGMTNYYVCIRELGNVNYRGGGPIKLFKPEEGVIKIKRWYEARPALLLLCACWQLETCHRLVVADLLAAEPGLAIEKVIHLTGKEKEGVVVPVVPAAPDPQPSSKQLSFF